MTRSAPPDHYATLGVSDTAAHETVRAAYRRLIRTTHPDLVGDDPAAVAKALELNEAWGVLKDPSRRAEYDRDRAAARARQDPTRPTGGPGTAPSTAQLLREAAARQSAYSAVNRAQREAFSAATWRLGLGVVVVGALLLALIIAR